MERSYPANQSVQAQRGKKRSDDFLCGLLRDAERLLRDSSRSHEEEHPSQHAGGDLQESGETQGTASRALIHTEDDTFDGIDPQKIRQALHLALHGVRRIGEAMA